MKHRILITNDDGIQAPGLAVMERIAQALTDDVWVVAPDFERSGASRSVSLAEPIRVRQFGEKRFSLLRGTPADCTVIALNDIMKEEPPTLVLSGVNRGVNLAEELTYSGTVAGAMEATMFGVPSIAMSQAFSQGEAIHWATAEAFGATVIETLLSLEPTPGVFHNVNFPDLPPDEVKGVRAVRQGNWGSIRLAVDNRIDARNFPYAWLSFIHEVGDDPIDTDIGAVHDGWISVTPLHADITHYASLADLHEVDWTKDPGEE
ncbi:MAG: 5'/3'-nucleotidase SurE [Betaproteobacteria bacterium]|nr:5'/3'-nucleotidase SurE [Betaproteobacteria bacterium]